MKSINFKFLIKNNNKNKFYLFSETSSAYVSNSLYFLNCLFNYWLHDGKGSHKAKGLLFLLSTFKIQGKNPIYTLSEFFKKAQFPLLVSERSIAQKKVLIPSATNLNKLCLAFVRELSIILKMKKDELSWLSKLVLEVENFKQNKGQVFDNFITKKMSTRKNAHIGVKSYSSKSSRTKLLNNVTNKNQFSYL